jgi:hypothetical protein
MRTTSIFTVRAEPTSARLLTASFLSAEGYALEWDDEWDGTARKGSRALHFMAGGIAQSYSFDLNIRYLGGTNGDTRSSIEMRQDARGFTGDRVATSKTQAEVDLLDAGLRCALESAGVLEHSEMARC